MDTTTLVGFITGGSLVSSLILQSLKGVLSQIDSKWGSLITQIALFVICLAVAGVMTASTLLPQSWLLVTGAIFMGAVTLYEVLYKAIFKNL